jgi:hypothetical protein
MRMAFSIGSEDPIDVVIERNWMTGKFTCSADGKVHQLRNPRSPSTHFNPNKVQEYTVEVGTNPHRVITIEHRIPLFGGFIRPQEYSVTFEGQLVSEYRGY